MKVELSVNDIRNLKFYFKQVKLYSSLACLRDLDEEEDECLFYALENLEKIINKL